MSSAGAFIQSIQGQHQILSGGVDRWANAVRAAAQSVSGDEAAHGLVMPTQGFAGRPFDLRTVSQAYPSTLASVPDDEVRGQITARFERIAVELTATNGELMQRLSGLALEAAMHRTIIAPEDVFDVSATSVLLAASVSNLFYLAEHHRKAASKKLRVDDLDLVVRPLQLAESRSSQLRPGDLWFLDLAARSVRVAHEQAVVKKLKAEAEMVGPFVPRFIALSIVQKLLEVDRFGGEIAKRSNYKLWPGLETLIADPGAGSLRTVLVGELARHVCEDRSGLVHAAFFRFLETLGTVTDTRMALKSRLLVARLLWEILEQDEQMLTRLLKYGKLAASLLRAIAAIEPAPSTPVAQELSEDTQRLVELSACLHQYASYHSIVSLHGQPGQAAGSCG